MKTYTNETGSVIYLNSGDWIENLTSLEYYDNDWHIFQYNQNDYNKLILNTEKMNLEVLTTDVLYQFYNLKQGA